MTSTLATTVATIEVSTYAVGTTAIDFAAELDPDETITDASAVLLRTSAVSGGSEVVGFATAVTVDGTSVDVAWTGAVLVAGSVYILVVTAELDTGAFVPTITTVTVPV